jgi:carbonic anhydrase
VISRISIILMVLTMVSSLPAGAATKSPAMDPATALQRLLEGNQRYTSNRPIHPEQRPSAAAQHPFAVILSCSDSRVPPEIVFDQGVGNLFVVRVAGNTYDKLALSSIEYAVDHLGSRLIIVMGHDQCGAVTAAAGEYPNPQAGPMLENIYPAVRDAKAKGGDVVSDAISENAVLIAQKLAKEPHLAAKISSGELKIMPARYKLASGEVKILQPR